MPDKISVLLVDDHALVRRGFRRMLDDDETLEVVGEASNGAEAVQLAEKLHPQVIVMDCALPEMTGLEATRKILQSRPETAILMLSMHSEDTLVRQALDAGARGYVLKNAIDLDLASAIKKVAAGKSVIDPQLARTESLRGERDAALTNRELEILQHIVAAETEQHHARVECFHINDAFQSIRACVAGHTKILNGDAEPLAELRGIAAAVSCAVTSREAVAKCDPRTSCGWRQILKMPTPTGPKPVEENG